MRKAVTKITWWLCLGIIAGLVVFAQLDRQSRYAPHYAGFVPDGLRYFGQYHTASAAIAQGAPETSLLEAKALIWRRPLPAENLALLAAAQARRGTENEALGTIQLAARRGWRERRIQTSMLELAIAAKDGPEAVRRFAALFALNGADEQIQLAAPRVFVLDGASEELSRILASNPRWKSQFLRAQTRLQWQIAI